MGRLIDEDIVIDIVNFECGKWTGLSKTIEKEIKELPSADVQPVVRCRDCIYSKMTTDGSCKYCEYLANEFDVIDAVYFCGNDFCSHGKRKGADNG